MKTTHFIIYSCFIIVSLLSCKQEGIDLLPKQAQAYLGTYDVNSLQHSGLHPVYDSVGNVISHEEQWQDFSDPQLTIGHLSGTDSLLVDGLNFSFNLTSRVEVKAVWKADTLHFNQDRSYPTLNNNFIRGKIWLEGDSLQLDYYWDRSDTYSSFSVPQYGYVRGRGLRLD